MLLRAFCICIVWSVGWSGVIAQPTKKTLPYVRPVTVAELQDIVRKDSGNVVLVNVWATWCKWCKEEMPALLKLNKKFETKGLKLILVSADDVDITETEVKPALETMGVDFSTYIMRDSTEEAFIVGMNPDWNGALPTSFIYDRTGTMVEMLVGERTMKEFEAKVIKYLK